MNSSLKTILWRTAVTVAVLIIIVATFYAEENARGLRAWQKAEKEIASRGESLNWDDCIPRAVPDDQNFYKAPMMTEWFVRSTNGGSRPSLTSLLSNPENSSSFIDEVSASNYLAWSTAFAPHFSQIRDALKRPAAWMEGDYTTPFQQPLPNFVSYRLVGQVLVHRAKCQLLLGEPDKALDDLTLLHNLNLTLVKNGKPSLLVAAMVHTAITGLYADAVACGLYSHAWREPELIAIQRQLAEIDLLPIVGDSLRNERSGICRMLDTSSVDKLVNISGHKSASDLGWWFMPGGWVYQNKAVIATVEEQMIESVDFTNETVSPHKARIAIMSLEQIERHVTPWNFIAVIAVPNFSKAYEAMARNQTWVDQAQIVCALERYRLANGKYPATLAALVPQYIGKIPHDIITGKPMTFALKDEQDFLLYSIGWNETDDGGITALKKDGTEDRESGDWVWHYPAL